jgi:flagellar biosynthesis protein FlhF
MSAARAVEKRAVVTDTKTFRGRTLEELLPQIKADLGPDAEIIRQREGLTGGVGGFFQRACVEVDARPGEPEQPRRRFDAYDDEPAMPEPFAGPETAHLAESEPLAEFEPDPLPEPDAPTAEGLSAPGIQEILRQASPFADQLAEATRHVEPPQPRPQVASPIADALADAGIARERADEIVAETVSHRLPFASPRQLRKLARQALARRIPIAPTPAAGGRSLAFVGPAGSGKTLCTAHLAVAYASGSDLPVVCVALQPADGGSELRSLVEPHGIGVTVANSAPQARAHVAGALGHAVVVVDTPSSISPAELETLELDEVHLALPSTYSGPAAAELAERLAHTRVALTHLDETTRVGGLVDFLVEAAVPLSYVSRGPAGLEPADALDIAALVLP